MTSIGDRPIRSDRPQRDTTRVATLAVSFVALLVSMLGFVDNHWQVKPHLLPSVGRAKPDENDPRSLMVWVYVKNTGHLDAVVTDVIAKPFPSVVGETASKEPCNHDLEKAEVHPVNDLGVLGEIPRDRIGLVYGAFTLPQSCSDLSSDIGVAVTFKYHDFLHIPYSQTEYIRAKIVKDGPGVPPLNK